MTIETTQCPKCRTVFRVTPDQLEAAGGWVRCGRCGAAFDATRRYRTTPPILEETPADPPAAEPSGDAPPPAPSPRRRTPDPELMLSRARHALHVAMEEEEWFEPPRRRRSGAGFALASVVLALALAAQAAWFNRDRLLRDPQIGPRLAAWLSRGGFDPGPVRVPEQLALEQHAAEPVGGAVHFSGTLVNEAPYTQHCPDLLLAFLDPQGTVRAARRFTPREYLPDAPSPCRLAPGARRTVRLELADPGISPLAYRFEFL